jgi:hypothetical protein
MTSSSQALRRRFFRGLADTPWPGRLPRAAGRRRAEGGGRRADGRRRQQEANQPREAPRFECHLLSDIPSGDERSALDRKVRIPGTKRGANSELRTQNSKLKTRATPADYNERRKRANSWRTCSPIGRIFSSLRPRRSNLRGAGSQYASSPGSPSCSWVASHPATFSRQAKRLP